MTLQEKREVIDYITYRISATNSKDLKLELTAGIENLTTGKIIKISKSQACSLIKTALKQTNKRN